MHYPLNPHNPHNPPTAGRETRPATVTAATVGAPRSLATRLFQALYVRATGLVFLPVFANLRARHAAPFVPVTWIDRLFFTRTAAAAWSFAIFGVIEAGNACASSIWGGYLCTAFTSVFSSELKSVISLMCTAGAVGLWMLDDGQSKIKLMILRIVAGTLVLFNLISIWATVTSQSSSCSSS
ncbi:hypothetical protein [Paraburkholderia tropica]|uniref:hypothetical protein n=1 Tax=Paraburkholderia tropica TaxID=92647 RepID=UPI002AB75A56|nr:hypothetical protein [Paraburkholderia tropica]